MALMYKLNKMGLEYFEGALNLRCKWLNFEKFYQRGDSQMTSQNMNFTPPPFLSQAVTQTQLPSKIGRHL